MSVVAVATANTTFDLMVNAVLTVFTPSVTTMVSAPPGRAGTVTVVWNMPVAVVVRHAVGPVPV